MSDDAAPQLRDALHRVLTGKSLDASQAEGAMAEIMAGQAGEGRIAGYLVALRMKGETADEVVGSARALRAAATTIHPARDPLVDTCGTGGDASGTFNISTGAALVVAAAGVGVAKHGNRSVSSECGSADVLDALGIPIDLEPAVARASVEEHGFAFLFAPRFHGAIKHAMPARIALASRTIFNLLGPLVNPAEVPRQVMGVFSEEILELAGEALRGLGTLHAFVVHSEDGLDEVSLAAPTHVLEVRPEGIRRFRVDPGDFGLERAPRSALRGGNAEDNATILRRIFAGDAGPPRDAVIMNAAMALVAAGTANGFHEGADLAAAAIDDGRARALVIRLAESSP